MLNEKNFILYAAKHYDNPECHNIEEFHEDLSRIKYLKKIFKRYVDTGDINIRLTLNYIITFYNMFGSKAATDMLFFKFPNYIHILKPFLVMLNYMPESKHSEIMMDEKIIAELRKL